MNKLIYIINLVVSVVFIMFSLMIWFSGTEDFGLFYLIMACVGSAGLVQSAMLYKDLIHIDDLPRSRRQILRR